MTSIIESKDKKHLLVSISGYGVVVYDVETQKIDLEATQTLVDLYNNKFVGNLFLDSDGFVWSFAEQGSFFKLNFEKIA